MLSSLLEMRNPTTYSDETAGPSHMQFMDYYNPEPEYLIEDDNSSITYTINDYSPYSPFSDSQSASSYCTDPLDGLPMLLGEEVDFFSFPLEDLKYETRQEVNSIEQQRKLQIQQNEEIARLLSPIRRFQERMHAQQTRKHAENARRKFSLTNGMRQKQRKINLSADRPAQKPNLSVRRWQSEIVSRLHLSPTHNSADGWRAQSVTRQPVDRAVWTPSVSR